MKRQILISILSVFLLSGCQLASEGPEEGQLVGVYFTTDVVSIPGEVELEDGNISSAGSIYLTEGQPGGKLYAREVPTWDGEVSYEFPDVEGVAFYQIPYTRDNGRVYYQQEKNDAIQERYMSATVEDGRDSFLVEGTIYAPTWGEQKCIYANPIYQTKDGTVYLMATPDAFEGASMKKEGEYIGTTWSSVVTVETSEGTEVRGLTIKFNYSGKDPVEKVVFTQMTADHRPISTQEYPVEQTPETLTMEPETAYILVESHRINGQGVSYVDRILLDRNDQADKYFTTYVQEVPGILSRRITEIIW